MTITTETVRIAASPVISLKGKGKAQREMAFMQIAPLSFIENISRVESIANLRAALGAKPSEPELATAQTEWIIGRVASRLPAGEFPQGCADDDAKLEFARKNVLHYASAPKEGTQPRKLRAGQLGRRSALQQKVYQAAKEAWSQVNAELGFGNAKPQAEKNKGRITRSTNANPKRGDGKGAPAPSHAQLITPTAPVTSDDYVQFMQSQLTTLCAYDQKHAKKRPVTHSAFAEALMALKSLSNKAASDYELRKAAAKAEASK